MTVVLKPHLTPCSEAIKWLSTQPDAETAWNTCDCADWMLWLVERAGVEKPVFVRIACDIARTMLYLVSEDEDRPRLAIEAAEAWLANPTEENTIAVDEAAEAAAEAAAVARAAYWAACEAASWAARTASWSACGATDAAAWVACEASCAASAHAADDAAVDANFADIVRKNIPFSAVLHLVETPHVT